jgi:hypothetical protein
VCIYTTFSLSVHPSLIFHNLTIVNSAVLNMDIRYVDNKMTLILLGIYSEVVDENNYKNFKSSFFSQSPMYTHDEGSGSLTTPCIFMDEAMKIPTQHGHIFHSSLPSMNS